MAFELRLVEFSERFTQQDADLACLVDDLIGSIKKRMHSPVSSPDTLGLTIPSLLRDLYESLEVLREGDSPEEGEVEGEEDGDEIAVLLRATWSIAMKLCRWIVDTKLKDSRIGGVGFEWGGKAFD